MKTTEHNISLLNRLLSLKEVGGQHYAGMPLEQIDKLIGSLDNAEIELKDDPSLKSCQIYLDFSEKLCELLNRCGMKNLALMLEQKASLVHRTCSKLQSI